uniref:Major sperm protein n=1 Tax=Caenorhabditis japonica TaxID=281687 RepID=A0A8R1HYU8_CAEJA
MPHIPGKSDKPSKEAGPLVADVKKIKFDGKYLGWEYTQFTFNLTNESKDRYAWKVKTSSNRHYSIETAIGILDPDCSTEIVLYHIPGVLIPKNGFHHISIYWIKLTKKDVNARMAWQVRTSEGCMHLSIDFPKKLLDPRYSDHKSMSHAITMRKINAELDEFESLKNHYMLTNPELKLNQDKKKEADSKAKVKA